MCHNVDTVAVEASAVPISANGPRTHCAPTSRAGDCNSAGGKGIVVHIFLQIAVARLSKPRFAPFSFPRDATLSQCLPSRLGTRRFHPPI